MSTYPQSALVDANVEQSEYKSIFPTDQTFVKISVIGLFPYCL